MKKKFTYERLIIKYLCEAIPVLKYKVLWRFVSNLNDYGSCYGPVNGRITISISTDAKDLIDTIIHEYAHALDYDRNGEVKDFHGDSWGKCYAEAYRTFLKILEDKKLERN